jgi:transposase
LELLGGLEGESQIPVEATYGWEWLAELLEDAGYDTHLAHPLRPVRKSRPPVPGDGSAARAPRQRLDSLLSLIDDFDREITITSTEIDQQAKVDDRVAALCQIRGVGRYTAMLIIAEVGDIRRFPSARHLCA